MKKRAIDSAAAISAVGIGALITILIYEPLSPRIYRDSTLVRVSFLILGLVILLWAALKVLSWKQARHERFSNLVKEFAVYKSVSDLESHDLGLSNVETNSDAGPFKRPYNSMYIPRTFQPIRPTTISGYDTVTESTLVSYLRGSGVSVAIVGSPLEGKTRAAFELLKRLPSDHLVIVPHRSGAVPSTDAVALTKQRSVVVVLDDIYDFVSYGFNLLLLLQPLIAVASRVSVLATSRNGDELRSFLATLKSSSSRVAEELWLLQILPMQSSQKEQLAASVGRRWYLFDENRLPTPGAIVMDETLAAMRYRFQRLPPDAKSLLRCLRLLDHAGFTQLIPTAIRSIEDDLFGQRHSLDDVLAHLEVLKDDGFLRSFSDAAIIPELAYLRDESVVSYGTGRSIEADLLKLAAPLIERRDSSSLRQLALAVSLKIGPEESLQLLKACLKIDPQDHVARIGTSLALILMERYDLALESARHIDDYRPKLMIEAKCYEGMEQYQEAVSTIDSILDRYYDGPISSSETDVPEGLMADLEFAQNVTPPHALISARFMLLASKANCLSCLGDYEQAVRVYDSILQHYNGWARVWLARANALWHWGCQSAAVESVTRATDIAAEFADAWHAKAQMLYGMDRADNALSCIDTALTFCPGRTEMMRTRLDIMRDTHDADAIIAYAQSILEKNPREPNVHRAIGLEYHRQETHALAISALERATAVEPTDGSAWGILGLCHYNLGQYESARTCFEKATELGCNELPCAAVGMTYHLLGLDELALEYLETGLDKEPEDVEAWKVKGACHINLEEHEEALFAFETVAALDSDELDFRLIGFALNGLERHDEALEYLDEAIREDADDGDAWNVKAMCHVSLRQYDEAYLAFDRQIDLKPDAWFARLNRIQCLLILERKAEARKELRTLPALDPLAPHAEKVGSLLEQIKGTLGE